jgi:hypothetical protein
MVYSAYQFVKTLLSALAHYRISSKYVTALHGFYFPYPLELKGASTIPVSELVDWVRNVVLIKCIFGSGSGFWVGGYMSQLREWGS